MVTIIIILDFRNITRYDQFIMIHNMTDFYSLQWSNGPYQLSLQFKYEQVMSTLLMDNEFIVCVYISMLISVTNWLF